MSERITKADVDRLAETVSEDLADGFAIVPGRRYGYTALDLYRRDPDCTLNLPDSVPGRGAGWLMAEGPLFAGSAREVYTYLQGMRRAQLLRRKGE